MNELEKQLSYPHADQLPALGESIEVAAGVRWVRMHLPFALDHINLWLLRDEIDGRQGWTAVDCGVDNEETRAAWNDVFETQLDGLPILRLIVTHMHPDHIGLAHWLTDRWSTPDSECRMWISAGDFLSAKLAVDGSFPVGGVEAAAFFYSHGLTDDESQQKIKARGDHYRSLVPSLPTRHRRLLDGMKLSIGGREWLCHVGYGHAPEHMSIECRELGVLISGDMVLPRISTNISVSNVEPESDALALYLESIERMRALPADTLVLPSHGRPFRGMHIRIDQLQDHHRLRLAEVLEACAQNPGSATDMLMVLFKRKLDMHQTSFAMGESVAHLNALWHGGKMTRRLDADGVYRFSTVVRPATRQVAS